MPAATSQGRVLQFCGIWLGLLEPMVAASRWGDSSVHYSPVSFATRISGLVGDSTRLAPSRAKGLRVIVSGLSRTGTQTIKHALNTVGYSCYHTEELVMHRHNGLWLAAVANDTAGDDALRVVVDRVLDMGYDCVVDLTWPWSPRLLALYPQAKVLHTVRDSPEAWFRSFNRISRVFLPLHGARPFRWLVDFEFMKKSMRDIALVPGFGPDSLLTAHPFPWVDIPTLVNANEESLIAAYRRQEAVMEALTPPDQLLVFNVKQGWDPLCSFLEVGKDCPEGALPHLNDAQHFDRIHAIMLVICYTYPILPLLPSIVVGVACLRFFQSLLRVLRCPVHMKQQ